jgi:hypothetical protein
MTKAMWLFRNSQAPSWLSGPRTDVAAELPLSGPASRYTIQYNTIYFIPIKVPQGAITNIHS